MLRSEQDRLALFLCALMLSTLALAGTGCVEHALRKENRTPDYSELPRPAPRKPEDGSVLRGPSASGSLLFLDRKARGVGDLVTVIVMESMSAQGSANTTTDKTSKIDAKASSDIGWTQAMQGAARWFFGIVCMIVRMVRRGTPSPSRGPSRRAAACRRAHRSRRSRVALRRARWTTPCC